MQLDVSEMLQVLNHNHVDYLVVGGMNFLFRHEPILTYDLDIWIRDTPDNRARCIIALNEMGASWGESEASWQSVGAMTGDWLLHQSVFSLLTRYGALDVFRSMAGLVSWEESSRHAEVVQTANGVSFRGLSDEDMLACQEALEEGERKLDRIRILRRAILRGTP